MPERILYSSIISPLDLRYSRVGNLLCEDDHDMRGLLVQVISLSLDAEHFPSLQCVGPKSDLRVPGVDEREFCRVH